MIRSYCGDDTLIDVCPEKGVEEDFGGINMGMSSILLCEVEILTKQKTATAVS